MHPTRAACPPRVRPPWTGLCGAGRRSWAGCSSGWWETVVVDVNPGFSFASSGLLLEQDTLAEPGQPRRTSLPLPLPVPAPRSAEEPVTRLRGAGERMVPESPGPSCVLWAGAACPWSACFLFAILPGDGTGRRGAGWSLGEGASLWLAGPCQPSGKGTVKSVSAQLILGESTPAQAESWRFPSRTGLAVPSPAPHLPVLAGGFPCCPPAPYPHNPLRPTSQRAPATAGTGHTDRTFTPEQ